MNTKIAAGTSATYSRALPLAESSALADLELIEQHRALLAWPATIAEWRGLTWVERFGHEAPALPFYAGRSIGSPQLAPQATIDAEADIDRDVRARLADGRLRVIGFQAPRQLDAEPVLLPVPLVATAVVKWRQGTLEAGGMRFVEARVIAAEALVEPEPVTYPPPTDDRLVEALADLFAEDQSWEKLGPAKLAPIVAQRDRRFRPGNGIWAAATLVDKIKNLKQTAKAEARTRGV